MRETKKTIFLILFVVLPNFSQQSNNSENADIKVELIDSKQPKKVPEILLDYFIKILGPIVALIGIFVTLPLLRKKLTENHISSELQNIQDSNSEIQKFNQELIDKYLPYTYSNDFLTKENLETIFKDIQNGYGISLNGSSDVSTLMFYLKTTIQTSIRHYDVANETYTTRSFFGLLLNILELVNFYSTQAVQIPKSSKVEKQDLIRESLKKYVTHSHILKYKYFKRGVIEDPNSAHFTLFSEKVNRTGNSLMMRSIYQTYWKPNAIAKLLYINKIYAPMIIKAPVEEGLFGDKENTLHMIGFISQINHSKDGKKKTVDLIYSNLEDNYRFVSALDIEKIKTDYTDSYLENSNFNFDMSNSLLKPGFETIRLKFDKSYLEEKFNSNKKKFERKLK